jgi:uncharacterized lipoprotein NlpE involved in copper resistance
MRATIIAATLACLGLAGCDNSANAPAPSAQAVAPPCNCQPQNEAAAQTAPPRVMHRRYRHWSSYAHRDYNQSESYYQSGTDDQSADQDASNGNAEENVWVDGYGRSHYAVTASAAPDDRARLAPWHGYDQDCDEQDNRR